MYRCISWQHVTSAAKELGMQSNPIAPSVSGVQSSPSTPSVKQMVSNIEEKQSSADRKMFVTPSQSSNQPSEDAALKQKKKVALVPAKGDRCSTGKMLNPLLFQHADGFIYKRSDLPPKGSPGVALRVE